MLGRQVYGQTDLDRPCTDGSYRVSILIPCLARVGRFQQFVADTASQIKSELLQFIRTQATVCRDLPFPVSFLFFLCVLSCLSFATFASTILSLASGQLVPTTGRSVDVEGHQHPLLSFRLPLRPFLPFLCALKVKHLRLERLRQRY